MSISRRMDKKAVVHIHNGVPTQPNRIPDVLRHPKYTFTFVEQRQNDVTSHFLNFVNGQKRQYFDKCRKLIGEAQKQWQSRDSGPPQRYGQAVPHANKHKNLHVYINGLTGPNFPLQGRQGSRGCIPGSPGESGLVSRYGCESWTIKKAEHQRIDVFEVWCWRRLLRVPWTIISR